MQLFPFFFRSTHFFFTRVDPPFDTAGFECKFPSPHFNAFIDLDGDCLADLFLVCQNGKSHDELSYQIWFNDKKGGFKQARKGPLPIGTRSVGFADMDRDGTIDMVLTICPSDDDCSLAIAYNSQIPLCSTSNRQAAGPCRDPEALCVADPDFAFNFDVSPDNHVSHSIFCADCRLTKAREQDFTIIPISTLLPRSTLITSSTAFRGTLPVTPSIGDYNIDGYPDLLILTSSSRSRRVNLLESRPCDATACTAGEIERGRRAFRVVTDGAEALTSIKDAESAHWIDMDDDVSLSSPLLRI